jgi:hypothetical protein
LPFHFLELLRRHFLHFGRGLLQHGRVVCHGFHLVGCFLDLRV